MIKACRKTFSANRNLYQKDQIEVEKGKAEVVQKETRRAIRDLLKAKADVPDTDSETREEFDEQIQVERDACINKLAEFKEA